MINLLPYETKNQLKAAHTNGVLIKYLLIVGFAGLFLVVTCGASYLILESLRPNASANSIQTNSSADHDQAVAKVASINNSFRTAKTILGSQVPYSDILVDIAKSLPNGTIIDKLDINSNTINSGLSLKIYAKSSDISTQIKESFQKSTLLSNFNIQSVETSQSNPSGYPVTINATVNIKKDSAQ